MSSKKIHILQQNNKLSAIIITLIYIIIVFIQLNDKILFLTYCILLSIIKILQI